MPTMKQLIRAALDSGKSVRDLADDSGGRVKFQTFQELSAKPPKQFPKDLKTITGMSHALHVPETTIVLAYAKSLGIPVTSGSNFSLRLPSDVDSLSPELQEALLAVARAALRASAVSSSAPSAEVTPPAAAHAAPSSSPAAPPAPAPGDDLASRRGEKDDDRPVDEHLAAAARNTDPKYRKGRGDQGEAPDGGA
jgi:hypothetical protein